MGQTVRTTVQNSYVEKTMADGIHFGSSGGGKVLNSDVYGTGDDGIAFVRYAGTSSMALREDTLLATLRQRRVPGA